VLSMRWRTLCVGTPNNYRPLHARRAKRVDIVRRTGVAVTSDVMSDLLGIPKPDRSEIGKLLRTLITRIPGDPRHSSGRLWTRLVRSEPTFEIS